MTKKARFFQYLDTGMSKREASRKARITNRNVRYQYGREYETLQIPASDRPLLPTQVSGLRRHYGLSASDIQAWIEGQGGQCASCKRTDLKLNVDHDHITGKLCGLLCSRCNTALGMCYEDEKIVLQLAAYLRRTQKHSKRPKAAGQYPASKAFSA